MELTFISGTKLVSVIEIEYTIGYDGEGPIPSDPSRFKIWQESIFLNSGKHYTQERVGLFKRMLPIF